MIIALYGINKNKEKKWYNADQREDSSKCYDDEVL